MTAHARWNVAQIRWGYFTHPSGKKKKAHTKHLGEARSIEVIGYIAFKVGQSIFWGDCPLTHIQVQFKSYSFLQNHYLKLKNVFCTNLSCTYLRIFVKF